MRGTRGLMIAAALLAALFAPGLGVRLYMSRAAEDGVAPEEDVDFRELRAPLPQNAFLVCPTGYCQTASATSPAFAVPWERLHDKLRSMLSDEPRLVTLSGAGDPHRLLLIQHSALFRFPDIIAIEFIALGPDRSSLAIYSRARYGRSDFGVNRARVERWLALLRSG